MISKCILGLTNGFGDGLNLNIISTCACSIKKSRGLQMFWVTSLHFKMQFPLD
jgi:hypothetical protein